MSFNWEKLTRNEAYYSGRYEVFGDRATATDASASRGFQDGARWQREELLGDDVVDFLAEKLFILGCDIEEIDRWNDGTESGKVLMSFYRKEARDFMIEMVGEGK